jgi:hypothetical protein
MEQNYDSTADTVKHMKKVNEYLGKAACMLIMRGSIHDDSKLESPEKEVFDKETPLLRDLTYGSKEYEESMGRMKTALDHHYANNSHHPEHYENGVNGMDLFDLIEMFFDWKAAGERHADGNIFRSIEHNRKRFNLDPQIVDIFINTAFNMDFPLPALTEKEMEQGIDWNTGRPSKELT